MLNVQTVRCTSFVGLDTLRIGAARCPPSPIAKKYLFGALSCALRCNTSMLLRHTARPASVKSTEAPTEMLPNSS